MLLPNRKLNCIRNEARRYGLSIGDAPSGSVSGPNYAGTYSWDSGAEKLTINVTKKPADVSCEQLVGICHVTMNNCSIQ